MTTILQISDLHLLSQPDGTLKGVPTAESVALVLARAREEVADPACVVLSGDLSHEETVAGYQLLHDLLGDWVDRTLLIPGNHDDRVGMRQVFDQVPGEQDGPVWFQEHVDDWVLLGVDSHVPGEVHGQLSEAMLKLLADLLEAAGDRPTLIFLHHHPGAVGGWFDHIGLLNADSLESLLAGRVGVQSLFCGHIHHVFEGRIGNVPFHSAPSAAIQFQPGCESMEFDLQPPGLRVIELEPDRFTTRIVRLDQMPFTPQAT